MIVKIDRSLQKDVIKIQDQKIKRKLSLIIKQLEKANRVAEINNLKRLQGTKNYYRMRIGDYRLGLIIIGKQIELIRLIHRKAIYKYFP